MNHRKHLSPLRLAFVLAAIVLSAAKSSSLNLSSSPIVQATPESTEKQTKTVATAKPTEPASPTPTPQIDPSFHAPEVVQGNKVDVPGAFDDRVKTASAQLILNKSTTTTYIVATVTNNLISFTIPEDLSPGLYSVKLNYGLYTLEVASQMRVKPKTVELNYAVPTTAYRNDKGTFNFDVIGRNFSLNPTDNQIYVIGVGPIIQTNKETSEQCEQEAPTQTCLAVESTSKLHVVGYRAVQYQGPLQFLVNVSGQSSSAKPLVLSRMSETAVLILSIITFLLLGFIVYSPDCERLESAGNRW